MGSSTSKASSSSAIAVSNSNFFSNLKTLAIHGCKPTKCWLGKYKLSEKGPVAYFASGKSFEENAHHYVVFEYGPEIKADEDDDS